MKVAERQIQSPRIQQLKQSRSRAISLMIFFALVAGVNGQGTNGEGMHMLAALSYPLITFLASLRLSSGKTIKGKIYNHAGNIIAIAGTIATATNVLTATLPGAKYLLPIALGIDALLTDRTGLRRLGKQVAPTTERSE
ncbi:hypothetical protein A2291_01455 [candidate division WOR-1 bacterium RIFOXYB2_FULL_42_35]|uniref:Uncharacterized protein n=1 Tax=candidate division WOR-1 bacterium RIFOXYC2_FULL_41_25 TaxID=1802586 RepID=A0A1F4TQS2_UNCSA|nr:MAG: hypothetical protein A2247_00775 [candidate division WOR-1 bacterium RIFOXYA2_FULL_41_14]OGC21511.1 MAG: hypothetical protein A2291_01455 [candidate division WOR-1 bacterium RIFOXYB2_FULL_42_35]OGC35016.1 MAG: hypothetical protein A2462_05425 [candidate division WOR-1 bacterium RIFOXYC2_FULL_41_25]